METTINSTKKSILEAMIKTNGWIRSGHVAAQIGLAPSGIGATMKIMSRQGMLERELRRVKENNSIRPVFYYRLTDETKELTKRIFN